MDVCPLILGRPWKFDVAAMYDERNICYSFGWKGKCLKFVPMTMESEHRLTGDIATPVKVNHSGLLAAYRKERCLFAVVI